jgi:transposase
MAAMRGDDRQPRAMFSYVSAEERVPEDHPLRAIRTFVDEILRDMTREFDALYAQAGRPSIPPERLLRAQLLQLFYSIRSERLLMEQLDYNILFRWFVGLEMDEPVWVPTVFTKNRDRLLQHAVAHSFFQRVVTRASDLMSDEHFTVDGTLLEAWASQKSFQRKDGDTEGDGRDFRGQDRKNDTHTSTTDPDARLYRKSNNAEARLAYLGHLLMENRHGLIVDAQATVADGFAEREAATTMLSTHWQFAPPRRRTVGADKAYEVDMTPHVAQNDTRRGGSAIDARTTRHAGYAMSQHARPRIERAFAWLKTIAGLRKVKLRGLTTVDALFVFASAAFNIKRIVSLRAAAA